ncbi:MAG: DUF3592 domain-containing protein [Brachybacterium sp.]
MGIENIGIIFLLVPALMGLIALLILLSGVRDLLRSTRLTSQGQQARGEVISAQVQISGSGDNRRSTMVETIEFTTDRGQQVRTNPLRGDIGMLDRSGQIVTVFYDRQRPERVIAPKNGRSLSPLRPLLKIGGALVMLVFLGGFVTVSQGILSSFPS